MQQTIIEMAPPVARQNLPPGNLVPNDYNPNVMDREDYEHVMEFMKTVKRVPHDLRVRCIDPLGSDHLKHKHEIIDGYTRWDIAVKLGFSAVSCEVYQVSDLTAKSMCYQANKYRGTPRPFREAAFFYLVLKDLPANNRNARHVADVLNQNEGYVESRLLLWMVAPVAKKLQENALPVKVWEELAKTVRAESDLAYVEQAANIILPNAKDYLPANVRNLVASLRRQENRDQEVLKETVTRTEKREETLVDRSPKSKPPAAKKTPESKGRPSAQAHEARQPEPAPPKPQPQEPKPAMVLQASCYICGAEDETLIWTKSGTDRDIVKVVNRAKLKSFEKNLVQERGSTEAVSQIKREKVLVSK